MTTEYALIHNLLADKKNVRESSYLLFARVFREWIMKRDIYYTNLTRHPHRD